MSHSTFASERSLHNFLNEFKIRLLRARDTFQPCYFESHTLTQSNILFFFNGLLRAHFDWLNMREITQQFVSHFTNQKAMILNEGVFRWMVSFSTAVKCKWSAKPFFPSSLPKGRLKKFYVMNNANELGASSEHKHASLEKG